MSASMRNFMEAYNAVHNPEARKELLSKRDEIAEMDLSMISDSELEDLCEEALEELLDEDDAEWLTTGGSFHDIS